MLRVLSSAILVSKRIMFIFLRSFQFFPSESVTDDWNMIFVLEKKFIVYVARIL